MATDKEIAAAEKAADDMLVIDGVNVNPAEKEAFEATRKAQADAEKAVEESRGKSRTAENKARSNTDNK